MLGTAGKRMALGAGLLMALVGFVPTAGPASAADLTKVEIVNVASGLRADVMWGSTAQGAGVFLWADNTSAAQELDLLDSGNGYFRIRARHSGQCLMLDNVGSPNANGTKIIQYDYCNPGYARSEWSTRRICTYKTTWPNQTPTCYSSVDLIVNRATGRCLDAKNSTSSAPAQEAVLQQWDCLQTGKEWNYRNQNFAIKELNHP